MSINIMDSPFQTSSAERENMPIAKLVIAETHIEGKQSRLLRGGQEINLMPAVEFFIFAGEELYVGRDRTTW